jgi:hypothetical protein
MVVEHEFVTTLDGVAALTAASRFLNAGGFAGQDSAFLVGETQWTTLEMKRGRKAAARAKSIVELPQRIILNYDRGRVTVAASITASHIWGGNANFTVGFGVDASNESPKKMVMHQQLLIAIANGLEGAIGKGQADDVARADWLRAEQVIEAAAKKRKRRNLIIAGIIILFFAGLITLAVIAGSR